LGPDAVAHTYNPSQFRGRDWEDGNSILVPTKHSSNSISTNGCKFLWVPVIQDKQESTNRIIQHSPIWGIKWDHISKTTKARRNGRISQVIVIYLALSSTSSNRKKNVTLILHKGHFEKQSVRQITVFRLLHSSKVFRLNFVVII
jgi:hypothetical protein